MTAASPALPLIAMTGVQKSYNGPQPFRLMQLHVSAGERLAIGGLDAGAAEIFIHLVTGAALGDTGDVIVAGTNTRAIATDTAWLASLDRFGIITDRAVMIDKLPVAANLALPLTLSIEPIPADVQQQVESLAAEAGLARDRLPRPVSDLSAAERYRLHLARAIAPAPALLLFEDPTKTMTRPESTAFGETVHRLSAARQLAFVALTNDDLFARASGATRFRLNPATGALTRRRAWQKI